MRSDSQDMRCKNPKIQHKEKQTAQMYHNCQQIGLILIITCEKLDCISFDHVFILIIWPITHSIFRYYHLVLTCWLDLV